MTDLRQRMLEELQRRNFSETTIKTYVRVVEDFARYFGKRPDRLNEHDIRKYQVHLLQERKLTIKTVRLHTAALRFFYVKTLRRRYLHEDLPYPKSPKRLPSVLSQDEVARLIDSAKNLVYSTTGRLIALVGVDGLMIVDTPDAVLVADQTRSQDIKQVPEALKRGGRPGTC